MTAMTSYSRESLAASAWSDAGNQDRFVQATVPKRSALSVAHEHIKQEVKQQARVLISCVAAGRLIIRTNERSMTSLYLRHNYQGHHYTVPGHITRWVMTRFTLFQLGIWIELLRKTPAS
jgi:hypothetical protein